MINKDKLEKCYHKYGVKKAAQKFGVTQKTIYNYLKLYGIEKNKRIKSNKWYDKLPSTPEEYHKKWNHVKYRNWWGCGD